MTTTMKKKILKMPTLLLKTKKSKMSLEANNTEKGKRSDNKKG